MPKRTLLVCVEGPIGVGKSTLLDSIAALDTPGIATLKEPVDDWCAVDCGNGKNMLEAMYDKSLNSAIFQLTVLQSRFGPLISTLAKDDTKIVFSERGPWSEKYVFAKSNLNAVEFACYEYAHGSLISDLFPLAGTVEVLFLHLELPVTSVVSRIKQRGRKEEVGIDEAYLERLDAAHGLMKSELTSPSALGCESAIIGDVRHISLDASIAPDELLAATLSIVLPFVHL